MKESVTSSESVLSHFSIYYENIQLYCSKTMGWTAFSFLTQNTRGGNMRGQNEKETDSVK